MLLSSRSRELLKVIIDARHPVNIKDLAHDFQVSERTIKYDLKDIRYWLKGRGVQLYSQRNRGIWLEEEQEKRQKLRDILRQNDKEDIFLGQKDRCRHIALDLLLANRYVRIHDISEKMNVSRNTIQADLKEVEKYIEGCQLQLQSKTRYGIKIEGSELKIRHALEYVIQDLMGGTEMLLLIERVMSKRKNSLADNKVLQKVIDNPHELQLIDQTIEQLMEEATSKQEISFSDRAVISVMIRLCISLQRLRNRQPLQAGPQEIRTMTTWHGFEVFARAIRQLGLAVGIEIPDEEIAFICLPATGQFATPSSVAQNLSQQDLYRLTAQLVDMISSHVGVPLQEEPELFAHLFAHLSDRVAKYRNGILDPNPLTEEIMRSYPQLFAHVKLACEEIFKQYGTHLLDSDIAYIVLHFQTAYDRLREMRKIYALVVCGTGRGTARFLKTYLENEVKSLQVVGLCSGFEVEKYIASRRVDLIISVLPLEASIPLVIVNPLPSKRDIANIHQMLDSLRKHALDLTDTALGSRQASFPLCSGIDQQDVPLVERVSQEIIFKGFELSQKIIAAFKDALTESMASGLQLHIMLLVNRLTFGSLYTGLPAEYQPRSEDPFGLRARLQSVLDESGISLPPSEMEAILRYFGTERRCQTADEGGYSHKEWTSH